MVSIAPCNILRRSAQNTLYLSIILLYNIGTEIIMLNSPINVQFKLANVMLNTRNIFIVAAHDTLDCQCIHRPILSTVTCCSADLATVIYHLFNVCLYQHHILCYAIIDLHTRCQTRYFSTTRYCQLQRSNRRDR